MEIRTYSVITKEILAIRAGDKSAIEALKKSISNPPHNKEDLTKIGICYYCGFGITKDIKKAFDFFRQAAKLKCNIASYALLLMYQYQMDSVDILTAYYYGSEYTQGCRGIEQCLYDFVEEATIQLGLDSWLKERFDTKNHVLNLAPKPTVVNIQDPQESCFCLNYSPKTYYYPDPVHTHNLTYFCKSLNDYLKSHEVNGLSLSYNLSGSWDHPDVLKAVAENQISSFSVASTYLSKYDLELLANCHNLKALDISNAYVYNPLPTNAITSISKLSNLETLNISGNFVDDHGGETLIKSLSHLQKVDLTHTGIGKATVKALLANKNLVDIKVSSQDVGFFNKWKISRVAHKNAKEIKSHAITSLKP